MFRISNTFLAFLNIFSILISLLIVGFSLYIGVMGTSESGKFFYTPVFVLGLFILVVSIMGLVGSCCKVTALSWIYLVVMFLLILCLSAFTVFSLIVTNKGAGKVISGRGFNEYRLGNYSNWLQRRVTKDRNWEKIKSCLIEVKVCSTKLGGDVAAFYKKSTTPVQSGCCKPPSACGFKNKSSTYWSLLNLLLHHPVLLMIVAFGAMINKFYVTTVNHARPEFLIPSRRNGERSPLLMQPFLLPL